MLLIYVYAKNYRNFKDQEFALTSSYQVQLLRNDGSFSGIRITRADAFRQDMPPNILSISALVGRNAAGKTNFVEMIGAKRQPPDYGGKDRTDAYFLLYASNQKGSDCYYVEVVSPEEFGALFEWMETDPSSHCAVGWCRYDSAGEHLSVLAPETVPAEKGVMVSLCDRLQDQDQARGYRFPLERRNGQYVASTFASQVRVVRKMHRSEGRTVLRDPNYRLDLICDMKYLTRGPDGTPLEDTPLFPTLYDKAELSEEQRCAVRFAESWIKFLAGSQIDDFDIWRSLHLIITSPVRKTTSPVQNNDFSQICSQLRRYYDIVIDFLKGHFLFSSLQEPGQFQIEEFFNQIMENKTLKRTESSIIIPVASVEGATGTDDEILRLTQVMVDNFLAHHEAFCKFLRPVWKDISDGELWYIHLLAAVSEALENVAGPDTCILVLDEPEIHMHPDLARQLLDHLTQWIQEYYRNIDIQIILTTHSPFVLSDIEKGNVQILRRPANGDARTEYWAEVNSPQKQTYAANIYTLLTDSFFLESGFGEIARKQIRSIFQKLAPGNHMDSDQEGDIASVIHNVGERLIREQLDEKFRAKFGAHANSGPGEVDG